MNELIKRVWFAVPAAIVTLWITWIDGPAFEILFGVITLFTVWEIHRLLERMHMQDLFPLSCLTGIAVWFFPELPMWGVYLMSGFVILISVAAIVTTRTELSRRWFATLFNGIYAPVGFLMIVYIRTLGVGLEGFWLILTFFLMIWGNDVFAYFGGKTFGKTPLVPNISPQKTREGFWFGFLGTATGFLIVYLIADHYPLPFWAVFPSVAVVGILGPLGDVMESRLKRLAKRKDSSAFFPGHGGFFDRFDSMILSAPFICFLFYLLL